MKRLAELVLTAGVFLAFLVSARPCGEAQAQLARKTGGTQKGNPPKTQVASRKPTESNAAAEAEKAQSLRQKLTARDLKAAILLFEDSARQFRASAMPEKAAWAEREAGDVHLMSSHYQAALRAYERSMKIAPAGLEARCLAFSHMARTYATMGKESEADLYSQQALSLCENHPDPKTRADVLEATGETRFWSSHLDEAVGLLSQARGLFAESGDHDGEAGALLILANAKLLMNDRREALRLAGDAVTLWSSAGNRYGIAKARAALAFFASQSGEFEVAQCNCRQALPVFREMSARDDEAIVLNILGGVVMELGDAQASLDYYRQAKEAFASIHDLLGEAEAISGMGAALKALHQPGLLLPLFSQKSLLAHQARNLALMASAAMDLAAVYQTKHQYGKAEALYREALAQYRSIKQAYGEGDALIRLAYLRTDQGKDSQAIALFEQARSINEENHEVEQTARIQYELARIYLRVHRLDEARNEIEKTIGIIESQRLSIAKFDSRAQYFASVHRYYSLYIQVLMELDKLHPEQGFMQLAFEASEKSKVRSLLDLLASSSQASPCEETLGQEPRSDPVLPSWGSNLGGSAADSPQVLTLQQIQAGITDADTVLVEYALGEDASYAWAVDPRKIVSYELPPSKQIMKLAQAFRDDLMPLPPGKDETVPQYQLRERAAALTRQDHARDLARVLMEKMTLERQQRILIVPDGYLQFIPFAALPALKSDGNQTLLTLHDIVVLPSASALGALRLAVGKRAPPTSGVAILADPVFELSHVLRQTSLRDTPRKNRGYPLELTLALRDVQGSTHIARLPGSRREALAIQAAVGSDQTLVALGFDANRGFVLEGSLAPFRILHFATHGIIDVRHPEMSGLILSLVNQQGKRQDGYLRLGDIYKLKLSADLVVLSSCESALGRDLESEGIIGLPRGFLYAGARSVIASLWKVDDDATASLMAEMYARIRRGESPSTALRGAQLALAQDKRYSKPYYWAAFVLEGDYK